MASEAQLALIYQGVVFFEHEIDSCNNEISNLDRQLLDLQERKTLAEAKLLEYTQKHAESLSFYNSLLG